jgi:hypothetical protein
MAVGLYGVRCFLDGKESDLWVSDELPVDAKDKKSPLFASGKDGKLWPAIGEKALATAYGSYGAIEGGSAGDALSDLTGAPYRCIHLKGADQVTLALIIIMLQKTSASLILMGFLVLCVFVVDAVA